MKYYTWSVTTWCKKLSSDEIMQKGSENYKALVEASKTRYNNMHKQKRKIEQSNVQVTVKRRC